MPRLKDMTGQKVGRWSVLHRAKSSKYQNGAVCWVCQCECGTIKSISGVELRNGNSTSCGCYNRELSTTHGDNATRFHDIWGHMKQRCINPNVPNYSRYGGRGIGFDLRWQDYVVFKEDMHESYLKHIELHGENNTTLERIDNDGHYTPENCTWATYEEQANNTRNNREFEAEYIIPGPSYGYKEISNSQTKFAKKYGLNRTYLNKYLTGLRKSPHKGWVFRYV